MAAARPHGGQRTARRNAWAGMSADAARGRARREAEAALRGRRPPPREPVAARALSRRPGTVPAWPT